MLANRYSAAKTPYNTGRPRTGFGCVSCRLYCILCDYDSQNVPGKGCVRHRQPKIEIAGPDAGGFAGETLQLAHGGGVCAVGAAVLEIPTGSGGGVEASPRVGSDRSCGVPQSSGQPRTCGGGHAESSVKCHLVSLRTGAGFGVGRFGGVSACQQATPGAGGVESGGGGTVAGVVGGDLAVDDAVALWNGIAIDGMPAVEGSPREIKDVDFDRGQIVVHDGKGFKDRITMLLEQTT